MDGSAKYEVLQRIAGEKIVVFRGRATLSGQIVLLHQLTGTNDHTDVLRMALEYLLRNPASAGGRIVDVVEIMGSHFLVTLDQPECLALREWLKWELETAKPALAAPPAPAREPGEFTRLFQQRQAGGTAPVSSPPVPASPAAPSHAPPSVPSRATSSAPDEFTQRFGRGGHSEPNEPPPMATPASATPSPLASEKQQPGEFTRLFRSPLATPPAESPMTSLPKSSPAGGAPGEFTRIFGGGTPPVSSTAPPAVPPPAPPPVPASAPGSLTESLEPRNAAPGKPDASLLGASDAPGEFTRVIRGPAGGSSSATPASSAGSPPAAAAAPPMPPPFAAPAMPAAPSMPPPAMPPTPAPPAMPAAPQAPSMPAPAAPPASTMGRPSTALIILFVVLLVAALALIGYVVLRK
ncbi:MAG TPA: hypothetical protein VK776_12715 [Bryobacteraceae bacterium]|nr:hypothetical protein [Bryobacteraceae bacterium]